MVITVTCPSCEASFPVDPKKIPAGGVNGRCTQCATIFRVEKPPAPPAVVASPPTPPQAPTEPPRAAPKPAAVAPPPRLPAETVAAPPPLPAETVAGPPRVEPPPLPPPQLPQPPAPGEAEADSADEEFAEEHEPKVQGFTFGKRDPTDKAKRLARVLVSDMIMYNAERHQTALAHGTLVQDFDEEIQKSWKEYVEQVGEEMANGAGRTFWVDALNDILAKGKEVF